MIQLNLLPDVKLRFIKARRAQRLVLVISVLVSAVALGILIVMFVIVDGLQKKNISDLTNNINSEVSKVQSSPSLNKLLTIQNQLKTLPSLEAQEPVASRLFGYLQQSTPSNISLGHLNFGFNNGQFTISGTAPTIADVNAYVDTLIFTTYKPSSNASGNGSPAFSQVLLTSYSLPSSDDPSASFTITGDFNPAMFNVSSSNVTLTVPSEVTTRSVLDQPQIFQSVNSGSNNSTNSGSQ